MLTAYYETVDDVREFAIALEKVREVSPAAYESIRNMIVDPSGFFDLFGNLAFSFVWNKSQEGSKYWSDIQDEAYKVKLSPSVAYGINAYFKIVKSVMKFDKKAGHRLIEIAFTAELFTYGNSILGSFDCADTKEGYSYWSHINTQLYSMEEK